MCGTDEGEVAHVLHDDAVLKRDGVERRIRKEKQGPTTPSSARIFASCFAFAEIWSSDLVFRGALEQRSFQDPIQG